MTAHGFNHVASEASKDEWLTPPHIIRALGEFDLDPCAPVNPPWATAKRHYNITHDGLIQPWGGRVWCNPPYGNQTFEWMRRCAEHGDAVQSTATLWHSFLPEPRRKGFTAKFGTRLTLCSSSRAGWHFIMWTVPKGQRQMRRAAWSLTGRIMSKPSGQAV